MWRQFLLAGINLADYGVTPLTVDRLTQQDLRAIEAHHRRKADGN